MKGFTQFLEERVVSTVSPEAKEALQNVYDFLDGFDRDNYNAYLMDDIRDGVKGVVEKVFSQVKDDIKILVDNKVYPEVVRKYKTLMNGYQKKRK